MKMRFWHFSSDVVKPTLPTFLSAEYIYNQVLFNTSGTEKNVEILIQHLKCILPFQILIGLYPISPIVN